MQSYIITSISIFPIENKIIKLLSYTIFFFFVVSTELDKQFLIIVITPKHLIVAYYPF